MNYDKIFGASIKVENEEGFAVTKSVFLFSDTHYSFNSISDMINTIATDTPSKLQIYFYDLKLAGYQLLNWLNENEYSQFFPSKPYQKNQKQQIRTKADKKYVCQVDDKGQIKHISFTVASTMLYFDSLKSFLPEKIENISKGFEVPFDLDMLDTPIEAKFIYDINNKINEVYKEIGVERRTSVQMSSFEYLKNNSPDFSKLFYGSNSSNIQLSKYMSDFKNFGNRDLFSESIKQYDYNPIRKFDFYRPFDYFSFFIADSYNFCFKPKEIVHDGISIDIHSHYLNQAHSKSGNRYPYGKPKFYDGSQFDINFYRSHQEILFMVRVEVKNVFGSLSSKLKPGKIDFLRQVKYRIPNGLDKTSLFSLTSPDFWLMFENYNLTPDDYTIIDFVTFNSKIGLFDSLEKFYDIKQTSTGAKRYLAKLSINGVIGRFALSTRPENNIRYDPNSNEYFSYTRIERSDVKLASSIYIPITAFNQAYSRIYLIKLCEKYLDRVCYCDTDSLHICNITEQEVRSSFSIGDSLGDWSIEHIWSSACFRCLKSYIVIDVDSGASITSAGLKDITTDDAVSSFSPKALLSDFSSNHFTFTSICPKDSPYDTVKIKNGNVRFIDL